MFFAIQRKQLQEKKKVGNHAFTHQSTVFSGRIIVCFLVFCFVHRKGEELLQKDLVASIFRGPLILRYLGS